MKKLLTVGLLACSLCVAQSAEIYFNITLNGAQESTPNASPAAGGGYAIYDDIADTLEVNVVFAGLTTPATLSHVHLGAPGIAGPPIVNTTPYTPAATFGQIAPGPLAFADIYVPDLLAGNTYFNIHTTTYPGGEIRGQLVLVPEPSAFALGCLGLASLAFLKRRRA